MLVAFQVHVSVVFLSDTLPSVSRGLVQIQWNLGHWMTLKNSMRPRFGPNAMKFGTLDEKWNSLIMSPPSKKSQRSHSEHNPLKKLVILSLSWIQGSIPKDQLCMHLDGGSFSCHTTTTLREFRAPLVEGNGCSFSSFRMPTFWWRNIQRFHMWCMYV